LKAEELEDKLQSVEKELAKARGQVGSQLKVELVVLSVCVSISVSACGEH
jgi:hypothetical protein